MRNVAFVVCLVVVPVTAQSAATLVRTRDGLLAAVAMANPVRLSEFSPNS